MPHITVHFSAVLCAAALLLVFPLGAVLPAFFAALLHECAHLAAVRLCRGSVISIRIFPFGADIRTLPMPPLRECAVCAAGSVANLIAYFCFRTVYAPFAVDCLALGLLNLLPVQGLDGGSIVQNLLLFTSPVDRAETVSFVLSFCTLFLLWVFAAYLILCCNANPSLFFLCAFLFFRCFFCTA